MWLYKNKQITSLQDLPSEVVGFVYLIINKETAEWYVGKKNIYSQRTLPPLKGERRKRKVTKQTNWVQYQSSNESVKEWISPYKEILVYCYTKKQLTYEEMKAILCLQGLEDQKCMNSNVLGKFFKDEFKNLAN